jgi:hypothetical protein
MGFAPEQVGRMSLYQFAACVDGFNRANSGEDSLEPPGDEEFLAMKAAHGDL